MKQVLLLITVFFVSACAQTVQHTPLTKAEYKVLDFVDAGGDERWWGDTLPPDFEKNLKADAEALKKQTKNTPNIIQSGNMLAISGGGANGAFGAGLLAGWTQSGKRPHFDIVSGVSTGAIIAPFAFLGSEYDDVLLNIYSSITRDNVYTPKIFSGLVSGSAVADTASLRQQIEQYVTPQLVADIAVERKKGRKLFILTTYFDAMRPMVWDIGLIAHKRGPEAIPLIRQIILASASIPVLFPPVPIEWTVDGKTFTELHVDGGLTRNVYAYPSQINIKKAYEAEGIRVNRNIYLIQNSNSRLGYEPAPVGVVAIAARTTKGLLQSKGNADVEHVYHLSKRDDINFNVIEIPDTFLADGSSDFEPAYMKQLLDLGQKTGKRGNFWQDTPSSLR